MKPSTFGVVAVLGLALFAGAQAEGHEEKNISTKDFVIDFNEIAPAQVSDRGFIQIATAKDYYGLHKADMLLGHAVLAPGSLNKVHFHPHASEVLFVLSGLVRVCVVAPEKGALCNDLEPGQATVFPKGSIHYEQNAGRRVAEFYAVLNNENPGITSLPDALFKLPSEALSAAFGRSIDAVNGFRERLPEENPARNGPGARPAENLDDAFDKSGLKRPGKEEEDDDEEEPSDAPVASGSTGPKASGSPTAKASGTAGAKPSATAGASTKPTATSTTTAAPSTTPVATVGPATP